METIQSMFRLVVMVAVGAGIVKGWQMFGPSTEQVKSALVTATDAAEGAWKNMRTTDTEKSPAATARASAPPFANSPPAKLADAPPLAPPLATQPDTMSAPSPPVDVHPLAASQ